MSFKVLAIGKTGSRNPGLRYRVTARRSHLFIIIPPEVAAASGLKLGDTVQFQIGQEKFSGVFAVGKGRDHSRTIVRHGSKSVALRVAFPYLPPLHKPFPPGGGKLRVIDSDPKGVFSFAVIDSKS